MNEALYRLHFSPGEIIFRQGETGDRAYIIDRGHVEIFSYRGASELTLACLGEGELFGEMALIDEQLRSATARAMEATTLIVIRREQVRHKIERADPVLNLFLKVILERLRATNAMIDLLRHAPDASERQSEAKDLVAAEVRQHAIARLKLEHELQQAIDRGQLRVFFQPIVWVENGRTAGFEALLRWQHPERGLLGPAEFIGLAEETGLIVAAGLQVLEQACRGLRQLQAAQERGGHSLNPAFMSVNLSGRQIAAPGLVEAVAGVLEASAVDPTHLKLELTESVLMDDPERTAEVLQKLKALGLQLAVDDFGTGYSSLAYLHRFPFDVVKVDRSFVGRMLEDGSKATIVRGIARLARELGLQVVAEGVERPEELALLRELGCDYAQGYLFARPQTLEKAVGAFGAS